MNRVLFVWFGLLGAAIGVTGCTQRSAQVQVRSVSPKEVYGMLRNDFAVLVDVREKEEAEVGMAEPAKWLPMSVIQQGGAEFEKFVSELPKDKEIVFYCAVGGRAGKAAELLASRGFKTANMGGFDDWAKDGLPVRKP